VWLSGNGRAPARQLQLSTQAADPCAGLRWAAKHRRCRAHRLGAQQHEHRFAARRPASGRLDHHFILLDSPPPFTLLQFQLSLPEAKPPSVEGCVIYQLIAAQLPRRRRQLASVTWPVSPRNFLTGVGSGSMRSWLTPTILSLADLTRWRVYDITDFTSVHPDLAIFATWAVCWRQPTIHGIPRDPRTGVETTPAFCTPGFSAPLWAPRAAARS